MRQFFRFIGLLLAMLIFSLLGSALLAGPLATIIANLPFSSADTALFTGQLLISASLLMPTVLWLWLFKKKLLPDSFLRTDLPVIIAATLLDFGISFYLLGTDDPEISPLTTWARLSTGGGALLLTAFISKKTRPNLINCGRIIGFLIYTGLCLFLVTITFPFSPRGAFFHFTARKIWAPFTNKISGVTLSGDLTEVAKLPKPAIIVATHSSMLDIPILLSIFPGQVTMLSKKSVFYIPLFGQFAALAGHIFIDRKNGKVAMEKLEKAAEKLKARHQWLAIFAEGTRTPDGFIGPLKRGAFVLAIKTGLPVVPVVINGSGKVMPSGTWLVTPNEVKVQIGPVIDPKGLTIDNMTELQAKTKKVLLGLSGWQELDPQ